MVYKANYFELFKEALSLSPLIHKSPKFICDDQETTKSEISKQKSFYLMPSKKSIHTCISHNVSNKTKNEGNNIKINDFFSNASSYQNFDDSPEENATPMFFPDAK